MRWLAKLVARLDPSPSIHTYRFLYARGSVETHVTKPFDLHPSNISIVTDKPELRYHDGVTPGGIVIPVAEEDWKRIMAHQLDSKVK